MEEINPRRQINKSVWLIFAEDNRDLGILYHQSGQVKQAHVELSKAIEIYRDMEMTFWLPETEAALAEVESKA